MPGNNSSSSSSSYQSWTKPLLTEQERSQNGQVVQMQLKQRSTQQNHQQNQFKNNATISPTNNNGNNCEITRQKIKVVLVGDGAVGKTSLVVSYSTNGFPGEYEPTAYDNYNVVVNVEGQPINVQLCDTAGQDDFDHLRSLCYPETDVFLVCFSVVSPSSYQNVTVKWINEIRRFCPNTPVILVGTKCDLRSDVRLALQLARYGESPITTIQGHHLAHKIRAVKYIETSALTQQDLKEAFDQAIVSALSTKRAAFNFFWRHNKPLPLWRRWLCCWHGRSSFSSNRS